MENNPAANHAPYLSPPKDVFWAALRRPRSNALEKKIALVFQQPHEDHSERIFMVETAEGIWLPRKINLYLTAESLAREHDELVEKYGSVDCLGLTYGAKPYAIGMTKVGKKDKALFRYAMEQVTKPQNFGIALEILIPYLKQNAEEIKVKRDILAQDLTVEETELLAMESFTDLMELMREGEKTLGDLIAEAVPPHIKRKIREDLLKEFDAEKAAITEEQALPLIQAFYLNDPAKDQALMRADIDKTEEARKLLCNLA